ncbi:MAG: hypothetical protein M3227_07145 [Thermoproteota archaeon]|nr:hypothetical protein [Thermoproteota archaeon]
MVSIKAIILSFMPTVARNPLNKKCVAAAIIDRVTTEIVSKLLEEREKMLGHVKFTA